MPVCIICSKVPYVMRGVWTGRIIAHIWNSRVAMWHSDGSAGRGADTARLLPQDARENKEPQAPCVWGQYCRLPTLLFPDKSLHHFCLVSSLLGSGPLEHRGPAVVGGWRCPPTVEARAGSNSLQKCALAGVQRMAHFQSPRQTEIMKEPPCAG